MAHQRWQVIRLVAQFAFIRDRPKYDDRLDDGADGCALRHNQQSWARLPGGQAIAKVVEHRLAVMGNQNPVGRRPYDVEVKVRVRN